MHPCTAQHPSTAQHSTASQPSAALQRSTALQHRAGEPQHSTAYHPSIDLRHQTCTPLRHSSRLPTPRQPADPAPGAGAGAGATLRGPALTLRLPSGPAQSLPWSSHPGRGTSLRWVCQSLGGVCQSSDALCLSCYAASLDHLLTGLLLKVSC